MNGKTGRGRIDGKLGYYVKLFSKMDRGEAKFTKKKIQFLIPLIKESKNKIIVAISIAIFSSIFNLFPVIIQKIIIDDAILKNDETGLILFSILLITVFITQWFITYIRTRTFRFVSQRIIFNLRTVVFNRIVSLSLKDTNETKKGELLSVVMNDVNLLSTSVASGIISLFADVISVIGIVFIMLFLDIYLALIAFLIIPLLAISTKRTRMKMKRVFMNIHKTIAQLNVNVEESVSGIRVVKALAVESKQNRGFSETNKKNFDITMKGTQASAKFSAISSVSSFIMIASVILIGGIRFYFGSISLGDFLIFYLYMNLFLQPVQSLSGIFTTFQMASVALDHIKELLEKPYDIPEPENPIPLPIPFNGTIKYQDVSFSYGKKPFIKNLNLIINPGEHIGIVGETGAGKTTLVKLLTRLYDVTSGTILLDDVDIRELSKKDLRKIITVVSQDTTIFSDTIKNNILFGNPEATDGQITEATKLSNMHNFIQTLPEGYDTVLGDMGIGLSGGQKQLLAYTRLILAQPRIAILDEATSNLDSYTENLIQENLKKFLTNCTTIIIAHRFSTIQNVERLILIENGEIKAVGSHQEIYESNEYYRKLYDIQNKEFRSPDK